VNVVVAILLFGLLIAIHEAGHFLVARWAGMRVERFAIGFGPALASFRRGETDWRIGAVPFGGYVKIAGMGDDVGADDPGSYAAKPAWKRLLVILAGAGMNYLLAWLLLVGLLTAGAVVPDASSRVGGVAPGMPAAAAGLQPDDRIVAIGGAPVDTFEALAQAIGASPEKPMALAVQRGDRRLDLTVTPTADGKIGILRAETVQSFGVLESMKQATLRTFWGSVNMIDSLVALVRGQAEGDLMGPVGIAHEVARQAERGLRWLVGIAASLSLALGFFNLLPIPGLDGARAAFLGVEVVRRKPVDQRVEAWVHGIGLLVLLGLMAVVTVDDIRRIVGQLFGG
jgi:regulator of sigma E protease